MRLKLTLEYDGGGFHGFVSQPGLRTVQGVLEAALQRRFTRVDALAVAGRTDAGVHAHANVISVELAGGPPPERVAEALNPDLPGDLAVVAAEAAPAGFHARFDARARSYRYRIWRRRTPSPFERNRSWWVARPLDEDRLAEAAAAVLGKHDFRAFTPTETQHGAFARVVTAAAWHRRGDTLEFEITADSFLRHMVRTLVGTMVEVPPERIRELLDGRPRANAGATAPAHGLYLERVHYS